MYLEVFCMKKVITVFIFIFCLGLGDLFAQEEKSELYLGLDIFSGTTDYDRDYSGFVPAGVQNVSEDLDQDGFRLKFGAELENNWRIQGYFQAEDLEQFDNNVLGIGVDIIKGFELAPKFQLFVLGGMGIHWTELEDKDGVIYDEDYISAVSLKIGTGLMYRFTQTFEVVGGFDLQYRSWAEMDAIEINSSGLSAAYTLEQEDISKTFYLGMNIHF